jgi:hypothetical protein
MDSGLIYRSTLSDLQPLVKYVQSLLNWVSLETMLLILWVDMVSEFSMNTLQGPSHASQLYSTKLLSTMEKIPITPIQ